MLLSILFHPWLQPVVIPPVGDIVEKGLGCVEMGRDLGSIDDGLFTGLKCFLEIDEFFGD
jgi:hypothetical protein